MEKKRIWFLGDSFCEHDGSWVKYFREKYNLELMSLGTSGASLDHLIQEVHKLLTKGIDIREDDRVVICLTQSERFYSRGRHYGVWITREEDPKYPFFTHFGINTFNLFSKKVEKTSSLENINENKPILQAYKDWVIHLLDRQIKGLCGISHLSHLVNTMIPKLPTNNIALLNCFDHQDNNYTPDLLKYLPEFLIKSKPLKNALEELYGPGWNESEVINVKSYGLGQQYCS